MPVTVQALALQAQLDTQLQHVSDTHVRDLVRAWAEAWAEVSGDLQDSLVAAMADQAKVTRTQLLRSVRLRQVLAQIGDQLHTLAGQANILITSDLDAVIAQAAAAQAGILRAQLPSAHDAATLLGTDGRVVSDRALEAIVKRSTQQITSLMRPLAPAAYAAVRRELLRGVAVGDNPRRVAGRIVARAGENFNGGLTRALVIARTEIVDAHRAAAEAEQNELAHALTGWVWLCHLSPRTCPSCLAQNGTVHPLSEPGPLDHQQGRCSRMPKAKTWADLGFEGLDEPADAVPDAQAWFEGQPESVQVAVLGRERLDLLHSGAISWDDLSTRRPPGGWRPSYGVTPVKHLRRRANAA